MLDALIITIEQKKAELDRLRPLSPGALTNLEHAYDLEITYTSNAIEGNTLTQIETNLVIEQGITIGGKKLKDHLEAVDHHDAIRYVRAIAGRETPLTESDVRTLNALVLQRSDPEIAGRYATSGRYINTDAGRHHFPSPAEVPALMGDFAIWLGSAPATPNTAFTAHHRLVDIHPFSDGNGRTARLLMNLVLIRGGYPPVSVRLEDRLSYLDALQKALAEQGNEAFQRLLYATELKPQRALERLARSDSPAWPDKPGPLNEPKTAIEGGKTGDVRTPLYALGLSASRSKRPPLR